MSPNRAAVPFFTTLKNEAYHRQCVTTNIRERLAVAGYTEALYNRKRMHSTLGYRTPAQALNYYPSDAAPA